MSTRIGNLKGKIEEILPDKAISYKNSELQLLRFYGGIDRGQSLQLTIVDGEKTNHIQLDKETTLVLKNILNYEFNENLKT